MEEYIIDSHAHLDHERFDEDMEEIIARLEEHKVKYVINPASDLESRLKSIEFSNK